MLKSLIEKSAHRLMAWASQVDDRKVKKNVKKLRKSMPAATSDELIDALIKAKSKRTATVGVVTSVAGAVPIIGTALSLTAGMVADLGATITSQAELVLEIAEVLDIKMSKDEQREAVFIVMGLGAGAQQIGSRVSKDILSKLGQRYAKRWVGKVIPVAGIAAAGGINYVSTYLIGKRAKVYFSEGEGQLGNWQESIQRVTDFDKNQLSQWMQESKETINSQFVELGKNIQNWAEETGQKMWPGQSKTPSKGPETAETDTETDATTVNVEASEVVESDDKTPEKTH